MSNRLTKGRALAGKFASDTPGYPGMGGIYFSVAGSSYNATSFDFPLNGVIQDVFVKITSLGSAATSNTISFGLLTAGAASSGVYNCLVTALNANTTGIHVGVASTSPADAGVAFTYGSYFIASSSGTVTTLRDFPVANSTIGYRLSYTVSTTIATAGYIYPLYYELLSS